MKTEQVQYNSHAHKLLIQKRNGTLSGTPRQVADQYLRSVHPTDKQGKFAKIERLRFHYNKLYYKLLKVSIAEEWGHVRVKR